MLFSTELDSLKFRIGVDDLKGLFQTKWFSESMINYLKEQLHFVPSGTICNCVPKEALRI